MLICNLIQGLSRWRANIEALRIGLQRGQYTIGALGLFRVRDASAQRPFVARAKGQLIAMEKAWTGFFHAVVPLRHEPFA